MIANISWYRWFQLTLYGRTRIEPMQMLCTYIGGSRLYGLNTVASDIDYRGVFLNEQVATIMGLLRHEPQNRKTEAEDLTYWELRHFLSMVTQCNTQILECLWAPKSAFEELNPDFERLVLGNRQKLVNSEPLHRCLKGYMLSERHLALGHRKGRIGGARFASIEKWGFSPKNFVQLIRLGWAGAVFYREGYFPIRVSDYNKELHLTLMDIKTHPENWTVDKLCDLVNERERLLDVAAEDQFRVQYKVDWDLVDWIVMRFYLPIINQQAKDLHYEDRYELHH